MKNKHWIILAVTLVLMVALLLPACAEPAPAPAPTTPTPAPTTPAPAPTTPTPAPTTPTPEPTTPTPEPTTPTPAQAPEVIELKFSTYVPPVIWFVPDIYEPWMKEIEERTNGRVKITLFPSGSLGSITEHYQMALSGMADISHIDLGVMPGVFPLSEGISLPMIFNSSESAACTYMELVDKQLAATEYKDVKYLFPVVTPPARLHTATKPVHTLEDFAGMKISSTSEAGLKTLEKLGATPVPVPMTDVYTSMERGLVDGFIENNEALVAFKLMEVSKYRTDVALNTASCAVIMNLDVWNSLPADIQQIFDETTGLTMAHKWGQGFDGVIENILTDVVIPYDQEQGNPEFYTLPAEEEARWRDAVSPLYGEWVAARESEGLPAQAFFDDILELAAKYNK